MRVLRRGMKGDDVALWQQFLRGLHGRSAIVADGEFGPVTEGETQLFQAVDAGFPASGCDGVVGPKTLAAALVRGFDPLIDDSVDELGPNWPPPPACSPLSPAERETLLGRFDFVPAPSDEEPEGITITDQWEAKSLVKVTLPVRDRPVRFHHLAAKQLAGLFAAWADAGLLPLVKTWDGSFNARFIRGSRTALSNHSWGSAFDINYQWNRLGRQPALRGQPGSVRALVPIAHQFGFYWGGHFAHRSDGMHFEIAQLL